VLAWTDLRIAALGSGSDYSAFLQHNGVPSVDIRFGGFDASDGVYHSIYDDYYHFTKFLDTDFSYGRALAQVGGTLMIRLADADLLPLEFTNVADTVQTYVKELGNLLKTQQDDVRERNRQIDDGCGSLTHVRELVAEARREGLLDDEDDED